MSDKKESAAMAKFKKLKEEMLTLETDLTFQLGQDLAAAKVTLDALKEMGKDSEALALDTISTLLAHFVPAKKSKKKSGARFSATAAEKMINADGTQTVDAIAKAQGIPVKSVTDNLAKPENKKRFTVVGDKVTVK